MITAIYSLSFVHGAELWLLFWLACIVAYMGLCLMLKQNRTKSGIKTVLTGLLVAEVAVDVIWAVIYYHNGTYRNYGIGAVYGLFLWAFLLLITLAVVTAMNRAHGKEV